MTDQSPINSEFLLASAALRQVVRKTRACVELGEHSHDALRLLEVHARSLSDMAALTTLPASDENLGLGVGLLQDVVEEARKFQRRVEVRLLVLQNATGQTKARKLVGVWWEASSNEHDMLRDIAERVGQHVEAMQIAQPPPPPSDTHKDDAAASALKWWSDNDDHASKPWDSFLATYEEAFSLAGMEHAVRALLNVHGQVYVGEFEHVVKHAGFPFDATRCIALAQAQAAADQQAIIPAGLIANALASAAQERQFIAGQLLELNKEWVELAPSVQNVIKYVDALKRSPIEALEPKWADIWASRMAEASGKRLDGATTNTKEDLEQAVQANTDRHKWQHWFVRYMMLWRLAGQGLSCDVFPSVDFPGKQRVKTLLKYVEPMDEANLRIVLGGIKHQTTGEVWEEGKPDVYRFLRVWLVRIAGEKVDELRVGG